MNASFIQCDKSDRELLRESVDRTRRIETRLTKFLEELGFDSGAQRPRWSDGTIQVPSPACSIRDLLALVPGNWPEEQSIGVYVKGDFLMSLQI